MIAATPVSQFPTSFLGPGMGHFLNKFPKKVAINGGDAKEKDLKNFVWNNFGKEDFENAAKVAVPLAAEWKRNTQAAQVFTSAVGTFGVTITGKLRRKLIMKMLGLLVARRERIAEEVKANPAAAVEAESKFVFDVS